MNKYIKIPILFTIFYFIISSNAISESLIIPKKKPEISSEKKVKSQLRSEILPLEKTSSPNLNGTLTKLIFLNLVVVLFTITLLINNLTAFEPISTAAYL